MPSEATQPAAKPITSEAAGPHSITRRGAQFSSLCGLLYSTCPATAADAGIVAARLAIALVVAAKTNLRKHWVTAAGCAKQQVRGVFVRRRVSTLHEAWKAEWPLSELATLRIGHSQN